MAGQKVTIEWGGGGSMGPNATLKIDGKAFGIFYNDSDPGIDGAEVLEMLAESFNEKQVA